MAAQAVESGRRPQRTIYSVTSSGHQAAADWLDTPVQHIRDVRSQLLIKLALHDRAGTDPGGLLQRQRAILQPIATAISAEPPPRKGFDAILLAWHRAAAAAALSFLDDITAWRQPGLPGRPVGTSLKGAHRPRLTVARSGAMSSRASAGLTGHDDDNESPERVDPGGRSGSGTGVLHRSARLRAAHRH